MVIIEPHLFNQFVLDSIDATSVSWAFSIYGIATIFGALMPRWLSTRIHVSWHTGTTGLVRRVWTASRARGADGGVRSPLTHRGQLAHCERLAVRLAESAGDEVREARRARRDRWVWGLPKSKDLRRLEGPWRPEGLPNPKMSRGHRMTSGRGAGRGGAWRNDWDPTFWKTDSGGL